MNLTSIETGYFKLDGGAMFGVIPKVIWNKSYPANENNLIDMAMRSLLIIDGDRKILIDSGIGNKQSLEFLKYYYLHGDHTLEKSLADAGVHPDEITDNIITHLHFDHCGGSVVKRDGKYVPAFRNASYWISKSQWETALNPNAREGATYFRENFVPLQEAGKLKLIDKNSDIYDNISVKIFDGHTDGQIIPFIKTEKGSIVFMADLVPFTTHLHLPFIMSYDIRPMVSLAEKEEFLEEAVRNNYILFFQHDYYNECCTVNKTEKGFRPKEKFRLNELFG